MSQIQNERTLEGRVAELERKIQGLEEKLKRIGGQQGYIEGGGV